MSKKKTSPTTINSKHPLKKFAENFLNYLTAEKNLSLFTVENYRRDLEIFMSFNPPSKPEHINSDVVRKYKIFLRQHIGKTKANLRSSTINTYL